MRVIFIDDEVHVLKSLERNLFKWFKIHNIRANYFSDSKGALEFIKKKSSEIGVIISDQKMPDLSGSKLLNIIKKHYKDIVLIILSGQSEYKDFEEFIKLGISSYISKPWDSEVIKSEILKGLEIYRLKKENRELKERLEIELKAAKDFQKKILHISGIDSLPFKINITSIPSPISEISGDYYDLLKIDKEQFIIISGDISGHGIKPAFLTMAIKNIIKHEYEKQKIRNLPDFVSWLNIRIIELLDGFDNLFFSFSAIKLDICNSQIEVINAGQPPVIIRKGDNLSLYSSNNMVLGVDREQIFSSEIVQVGNEDNILMLSDGIHPSGIKDSKEINYLEIIKELDFMDHQRLVEVISSYFSEKDLDDDKTIITIKV